MKKFLLLLSIVSVIASCEKKEPLPPNTYKINVSAPGVLNGIRAYIKFVDNRRQERVIDTAMVINEQFTFTGKVANSAICLLTVNGVKGNLGFVLEPGELNIDIYKDSIQHSKVDGTKNNDGFNEYKKNIKAFNDKQIKIRNEINLLRQKKEAAVEFNAKNDELITLLLKGKEYLYDFIEQNPNLDISLLLLDNEVNGNIQDIERLKNSVTTLQSVINKNAANKFIGQKINAFIAQKEALAMLEIGKKAPDFKSPSPDGEMISLGDIRGKATIIDFWAAWCGPCRRENPNVVSVYEKYHDKGLEIISISLDGRGNQSNPKLQWLKAIEDDNMNWHHASSLMYFNDPVARLYNINSIPATFILDENGIIVAKNLRGPALGKKIAEMLD